MASQLFDSFLVHLGCVDDPRTRESPHRIEEILFLAVCATIAGADGPSDIENFGIQQEAWLRNHIELANGVPSHDTIGRVFSMVKPMPFQEGFLSWISTFRFSEKSDGDLELVAIDGKTERGSKTSTKNALHAVSAWAIDGDRAETTELENKEPRFGQVNAARRVARTLFLGSAPSSVAGKAGIRGLDRARVLLGCLQPGQTSAIYVDVLNRLADRLHYLNSSGDKIHETTRYWFDTRANLRREMEDRKRRFKDESDVRGKIATMLKKLFGSIPFFDGVHIYTPNSDVPDDSALRLVVLSPDYWFSRDEERQAGQAVIDYLRNHGTKPRYRGNRLIFLAPDMAILNRLSDAARVALAWKSIVDDVEEGKLNIDLLQKKQAEKELLSAEDVLPKVARECYKWLLCPVQHSPTDPKLTVESFPITAAGNSPGAEIERVCIDNELVITKWSPIHLRTKLKELYWKDGKFAVGAMVYWEDSLRYLYLSRLKDLDSLSQAIRTGAASMDFFGTAYGQSGDTYEGFKLGDSNVQLNDTLLLIEPEAAKQYEASLKKPESPNVLYAGPSGTTESVHNITQTGSPNSGGQSGTGGIAGTAAVGIGGTVAAKWKSFHGSIQIQPTTAKVRLVSVADEIISLLARDPNAVLNITVEIDAEFPLGVSDQTRRAISENANALRFKTKDWE